MTFKFGKFAVRFSKMKRATFFKPFYSFGPWNGESFWVACGFFFVDIVAV